MRNQLTRPIAIIGSLRIPFARSHTAYRNCSNQQMMSKVLASLVEKFALTGERLGDVSLGAVIKHQSRRGPSYR